MNIIARRELENDGRTYEVLIEQPHQGENGDFVCTWSLVDDSGVAVISQHMYGVDSVQALLSALLIIGERLAAEPNGFAYLGAEGTGFPRYIVCEQTGVSAWFFPAGR